MTFRKLLQNTYHKEVFNVLYRDHYKDKPTEEVHEIAYNYRNVWDKLLEKPPSPNKEYKIYIRKMMDLCSNQHFVDVCLFCNEDEETYAIDLTPWGELIDAEVKYESPMQPEKALAHILWEITFYGFTQRKVELSKDKMKQLVGEVKKTFGGNVEEAK